jgi:hypothetical protein
MVKLDHVSVMNDRLRAGSSDQYKVRAELLEAPTSAWRMRFQSAWFNRPECRQICNDIVFDNNDIFLTLKDSNRIADSVTALKRVMADIDRQADFGFTASRYHRQIG